MAAGTQAQSLAVRGLSWMLYLGAARQSRERSRTGSHPALCAKGALRPLGMEVQVPTSAKLTRPALRHAPALPGSCTL